MKIRSTYFSPFFGLRIIRWGKGERRGEGGGGWRGQPSDLLKLGAKNKIMSNRITSSQEVDHEDLLVDAKKRVPPLQGHEKVALIEPPLGSGG